ncbi:BNR repeat-containing protein [Flavobacterium agrisoli]|uniref:BNR repeat-containing protein n=1 Tax=Flavobacterium agrisoli TaxID=2793066 RepID=A0A934PME6_9FLAO|nr:BNR repeat-containing protein [Flavobacterium agrisoli]MBK0370207.1 BNR repeat-containing protein [Flavobacterium agrisoli]
MQKLFFILLVQIFFLNRCFSQPISTSTVGKGWAKNSVNTVIFRNKALTSFNEFQFTAYYDENANVVVAKRKRTASKWEVVVTPFKGKATDAHNSISIAVDSEGFLHMAWDHHDNPLHYAKSLRPLGLEFTPLLHMTGLQEEKVTYPEFHNLPDGSLLFCYRSGQSGRGNMVLNKYAPETQKWEQIQHNLLDGEGKRSAYWQMTVGPKGLYLSWVWRESWDVSTNHDLCYAFSADGGKSWQKSNGELYPENITQKTAEVIHAIPQNSNLINQTAMTVDVNGNPYIASYWNVNKIPQFQIVYREKDSWKLVQTHFLKKGFVLGGGGTKSIPISRPKILVKGDFIYLLFRAEERGNKISLAYAKKPFTNWNIKDITNESVGQWEPNWDKEAWELESKLYVFAQKVAQKDGEGLSSAEPTDVQIITLKKLPK